MAKPSQTTATLQTPPGRGGIAVVSLCGPKTSPILEKIFRPDSGGPLLPSNTLRLGKLFDENEPLDEVLVCLPDKETCEINLHGGTVVTQAVLRLLARMGAIIQTSPVAEWPAAHPQWNNPAIGLELFEALPKARSLLVASALTHQWSAGLSRLLHSDPSPELLLQAAQHYETVAALMAPRQVVLAGPPNAGKSTLANVLTGREVSLVHETAGTTRDWVRELANIDGIPVWLTDTAGLWEAPHHIDHQAVQRARGVIETADLVILLQAGDVEALPRWLAQIRPLKIASKCDIAPPVAEAELAISAQTGEGLDALKSAILDRLGLQGFCPEEPAAFTLRQRDLLFLAANTSDPAQRQALLRELLGQ